MEGGNGMGIERLTTRYIESWIKKPAKDAATTKLADGGGLYLVRLPSGAASWQVKYRFINSTTGSPNFGKVTERTFSVGPAPAISLADARAARRAVKDLIKQGIDPATDRRVKRAAKMASSGELFSEITTAWLKKEKPGWSEVHYLKSKQALDRDVLPWLGALPVQEIMPSMVTAVIERIQNRGVRETAAKVLQQVRSIFRLAAAKGMRTDNPAEPAIEILKKASAVQHHPALLNFAELGDVLRRAEIAPISPVVRLAHRLIAFTAVRISNAVAARWNEFDLDATPAVWKIPREQMKVSGREHDHKVVLPESIADDLRNWRNAQPEDADYVFPGAQGREHLSREAIEKALRVTMGLADKHSAHGWRASFSTLAKEDGQFAKEVVDLALDHIHDTDVARAYDRGERFAQRVKLMAWWGEKLVDAQQHPSQVVPLKRGAA